MTIAVNCGGLAGSQVLREEDSPLYRDGFKNMACISAGTFTAVVALAIVYRFDKRRGPRETAVPLEIIRVGHGKAGG
ncbi:hypothetical protein MBLNU230_g5248t1 [Neophaeotheca triangularis]